MNIAAGALASPANNALGIAASAGNPAAAYAIGQHFKRNAELNKLDGGNRPEEGSKEHIALHTLNGILTGAAGGNNALLTGLAAGGAELVAPTLSKTLYGKESKDLAAEEKAAVIALTNVFGAAVGAASGAGDAVASSQTAGSAVENNQLWSADGHRRLSSEAKKVNDWLIEQAGGVKGVEYYVRESEKIENSKLSPIEQTRRLDILWAEYIDENRRYDKAVMSLPRNGKERDLYYREIIPSMQGSIYAMNQKNRFVRHALQEWMPSSPFAGTDSTIQKIEKVWAKQAGLDTAVVDTIRPETGARGPTIGKVVIPSSPKIKHSSSVDSEMAGGNKPLQEQSQQAKTHPDLKIGKNNPKFNSSKQEEITTRQPDSIINQQADKKVHTVTAPIDFDGHIINAEIKSRKVVGGHSTVGGNIKIDSILNIFPNGVYNARISVRDPKNPNTFLSKTNNGGVSTMFPDSWTSNRIKVEVDHAYKNRIVNGNKWYGTTPSGVKVEGFLLPKTTAFPSPKQ